MCKLGILSLLRRNDFLFLFGPCNVTITSCAKRAYNAGDTQLWSTDEFLIMFSHNRCKKPNFGQFVIGESENSLY